MDLRKNSLAAVLLISFLGAIAGIVLGALLGALIPAVDPLLNGIGTENRLVIDLEVLVFGLRINVAGLLGVIGALLVYRKL